MSARAAREGASVASTSGDPNSPRPLREIGGKTSSASVVARAGGGKCFARSGDADVVSSRSSMRSSALVSSASAAAGSGTVAERLGERYTGRRSVLLDNPQGPTLLLVNR